MLSKYWVLSGSLLKSFLQIPPYIEMKNSPGWAIEVWNNGTILIVDPTSTLKWIGNLNDKKSEEFFDKSAALNKRS